MPGQTEYNTQASDFDKKTKMVVATAAAAAVATHVNNHSYRHIYNETAYLVKYLLQQCDATVDPEERAIIVEKIFEVLNKNPMILIYEPEFRNVVIDKMTECEEIIKRRIDRFNNAEYDRAMNRMKLSMRININNTKMLRKIYTHINDINSILGEYHTWMNASKLKKSFNTLRSTLAVIKTYPEYVPDHPMMA